MNAIQKEMREERVALMLESNISLEWAHELCNQLPGTYGIVKREDESHDNLF
ncbi:MAG: hypothetical protein HGA87_01085 [Desulfobulbaceae bacterium]|nr:hypothetical protein [Desulfobulbaceae bacterium]